MLTIIWYIMRFELTLHLRRSQAWLYPLGFFIIVVSLFPLAFTPDPIFLKKYIPGCVWIAALLSSLLAIETVFLTDMEDGYLEQLILCPYPFSMIVLAKLIAQWLITQLPLIFLIPVLGCLFHLPIETMLALCVSLLVGTPILTFIGSFGVALTFGLRQQGALLGLLILPLVSPVLIFGVNIVQQAQAGLSIAGPLAFLMGLTLLSITLLPWTIAATIKIGIDD